MLRQQLSCSRCISNSQRRLRPLPRLLRLPTAAEDPEPRNSRSSTASPRRTAIGRSPLPPPHPTAKRSRSPPGPGSPRAAAGCLGRRPTVGTIRRAGGNSDDGDDRSGDTSKSASSSRSLPSAFRDADSEITSGHVVDHFQFELPTSVRRGGQLDLHTCIYRGRSTVATLSDLGLNTYDSDNLACRKHDGGRALVVGGVFRCRHPFIDARRNLYAIEITSGLSVSTHVFFD